VLCARSADGTCRLWELTDARKARDAEFGSEVAVNAAVMPHSQYIGERYKDVTSVNWSPDGQHLATGCYDGIARVWTASGTLKMELQEHNGPVFSLKWSKNGKYLLSGSYDKRSIVWDPETGAAVKTYLLHKAPVLDVDWSDSDVFATCSSDRWDYLHVLYCGSCLFLMCCHSPELFMFAGFLKMTPLLLPPSKDIPTRSTLCAGPPEDTSWLHAQTTAPLRSVAIEIHLIVQFVS
jgi:WD40 repeat protein